MVPRPVSILKGAGLRSFTVLFRIHLPEEYIKDTDLFLLWIGQEVPQEAFLKAMKEKSPLISHGDAVKRPRLSSDFAFQVDPVFSHPIPNRYPVDP